MRGQARLEQLYKTLEDAKHIQFEVLKNENDWLNDYEKYTYSDRLKDALTRGLFEEHAKKADIGYANFEKAMVFCINPQTMEIEHLGGSSLLREKKSEKTFENILQCLAFKHRKIKPDLIMDNFGLFYAGFFAPGASTTGIQSGAVKDDDGTTGGLVEYQTSGGTTWNIGSTAQVGTFIQMGAGTTAPARADNKIQTALGNAPENAYVVTNVGGYTASNTIIYQGDANPTGGTGTVNEIVTAMGHERGGGLYKTMIIAHDIVTPGVTYPASKLLRGAYTWQI